ncbi:iron-sulfur electron transport protein [Actinobacillus pleuropneumoniae]|nr:iron-sulfur electron transport protein [Actinobacillus pleuropneumoniae]
MSHLQTSTLPFKQRVEQQVHNDIMRKAVVKAQETIGANRQKMVDELGNWEEWRDLSKQFRNHVLANLDAYLYQLSEKVTQNGGHVFFAETAEEATAYIRKVALEKKCKNHR